MLDIPANLPETPGCYQFVSVDERVLYVGKAKNLRNRLKQYFVKDQSALHQRTIAMLKEAHHVRFVELASEDEALIQEAALIRKLDPPYNVKLRADSAYPVLELSDHEFPRFSQTHYRNRKARVFGPFPSALHARRLADAVRSAYGLRPCRDAVLAQHTKLGRACLLGETGSCAAPCVDPDGYEDRVKSAAKLLSGEVAETTVVLRDRMNGAADSRAYETAAKLRDAVRALEALSERVVPTLSVSHITAVAMVQDEAGGAVCLIDVRDGVLVRASSFVVERALLMSGDELSASEVLQRVLVGAFSGDNRPPDRVVVSHAVSNETIDVLCSMRQAKVSVKVPQRGALVELLKVAERNASTTLRRDRQRRAQDATARRAELEELRVVLGLVSAPLRIECLDISHTMGQNTTAAFAVIEEGQPRRGRARTFNLDTGNDDVLSIAAALQKRVEAVSAQAAKPASERDVVLANLPQLFLIDGGLAQLHSAQAALAAAQCTVPVASIAKRLEEVYLPGRAAPLRLDLGSNALYVLQRARDEAHNVSIKAQRKRRQKAVSVSVLDTVKGLGAKRVERLRTEVGGVEVLRQLSREKYPSFLPAHVADELHKALHPELRQP